MDLDSFISDFENERHKEAATPKIVGETFELGQELINIDYLPKIQNIKLIKKYIEGYKEMNLYKRGWRLQFGSSRDAAGLCDSGTGAYGVSKVKKNIYISIETTRNDDNWQKGMRGMILHEIAHGIVFEIFTFDKKNAGQLHKIDDLHKASQGHGIVWKSVCKAISGSECRISYEDFKPKESFKRFKYDCMACGHTGYGDFLHFSEECSQCGDVVSTERNDA